MERLAVETTGPVDGAGLAMPEGFSCVIREPPDMLEEIIKYRDNEGIQTVVQPFLTLTTTIHGANFQMDESGRGLAKVYQKVYGQSNCGNRFKP